MPSDDGDPAHLVDVALAVEEVGLAVVGAERAVLRPVLADHRQQRAQVARVRRLADQHPHAATALLQCLGRRERLVVRGDPGRDVGVQSGAHHAGRMAVDVRSDHPRQHLGVAGDDAGEVHHLGHAERSRMAQDRAHLVRPERPDRGLEVARRDARRRHHEHVERQTLGRAEQPLDPGDAGHVGDLVRIADDGGRAARDDRPGELDRGELGRLQVHVGVDEARDQPLATGVDARTALV